MIGSDFLLLIDSLNKYRTNGWKGEGIGCSTAKILGANREGRLRIK